VADVVVRVEDLWKQYRLGAISHGTLRADLSSWWARVRGREDPNAIIEHAENVAGEADRAFWALRRVEFEVGKGEVLGVIGRNGAGKSTLLKILSRVTSPTRGSVRLKGRVASLLEVGTGFHPELTGRENIYLNGAILGMSRAEIRRKFDEIVAFAEVERFIETPVKRYSSGMYVRLAFAVAAHLDADMLIVDEVLAVGDAGYQAKCLNVLRQVGNRGVTVFFVSHNMASIRNLCSRCLLLDKGEVARDGPADAVVSAYLGDESVATSFEREQRPGGKPTIVRGHLVVTGDAGDQRVQIHLTIAGGGERKVNLDQRLFDAGGAPVGFGSLAGLRDDNWIVLSGGHTQIVASFPVDMLVDGRYFLSLDLTLPGVEYFDRVEHGLTFELSRPPEFGRRRLSQNSGVGVVEFPMRVESLVQG